MELVKNNAIEILSRRSVAIKDYDIENGEEEEEEQRDDGDRASLKIDLSMAEQFYYEVISSFEQEEDVGTGREIERELIFRAQRARSSSPEKAPGVTIPATNSDVIQSLDDRQQQLRDDWSENGREGWIGYRLEETVHGLRFRGRWPNNEKGCQSSDLELPYIEG
ncbi:hypothetical protein WN48_08515 [Eufriesea mexicana]|uniref:Uncharacterized protein n=1 Tax=Eufriesea mexicana TaxID=516756 RepID=A0A310SJ12_9HYME|nr:hypothetical protein WN48_08515 [Eufriesea mexicana]